MKKFVYFQPNKHKCDDCVVRACVKATGMSWEAVYQELCAIGLKYKVMPNENKAFDTFLKNHGFVSIAFKPQRGESRPTPRTIELPKGVMCVASVAGHLVAVDSEAFYDIWDCGDKGIYKYWTKKVA